MTRKIATSHGIIIGTWRDEMNRAVQQLLDIECSYRHGIIRPHREAFCSTKAEQIIARDALAELWSARPTHEGKSNGRDAATMRQTLDTFFNHATIGELTFDNLATLIIDESARVEAELEAADMMEATEDRVLDVASDVVKVEKARCPHYPAISRFHAIAKDKRLNTKNKDAIRAALAKHLGRAVASRDELTGVEWFKLGTAIKRGELAW